MDKVFGRCLESWISVQSVTWESVRIRFGLPSFPGTVKATLFAEGREIRSETDNGNNAASPTHAPAAPAARNTGIT